MIDERQIVINGECLISVYCENHGSRISGGVAFRVIMPPRQHQENNSLTLWTWSLMRGYLRINIIFKSVLFYQILV